MNEKKEDEDVSTDENWDDMLQSAVDLLMERCGDKLRAAYDDPSQNFAQVVKRCIAECEK